MSEKTQVNLSAIHELPIQITSSDINNSPELGIILTKISEMISSSGTSKSKEDRIRSLIIDIKRTRHQYQEHEILLNAVKRITVVNYTADGRETSMAIKKVNRIIAISDVKLLSAANNKDIGEIFDSTWLSKSEPTLSSNESKELQLAVEIHLQKKYGDMISPVQTATFFDAPFEESRSKRKLALLRELNEKFEVCHKLQMSEGGMYHDLLMLRNLNLGIANLQTTVNEKVLNIIELKTKIEDGNREISFYLRDKGTIKALNEISCALHNEMTLCIEQLKKLEEDRAAYKKLQNDENYVKVLCNYRDAVRQIANKKLALGQF